MRLISLAATPATLFFPSRSMHISIGKLALIGMLVATFFLFTAGYVFPGGAVHYPDWAEAIVHGTTLPPGVAQREVGFPLLYILGGFPFTHSFIGLTLILAAFAVLISVLVYLCLAGSSPSVAYYMGLVCIISLSPFTYIKFFYPDEAYIFFNLLAVTFLIGFIQSKGKFKLLYFFTLTALMASFTRTAGNLMYPVLLAIAYFSVRGSLRHYVICILIFALGTGLYQWHRYEIFDIRHQPAIPSGKGMQTIYPIYLYLRDFGLQLSPDIGPNTKLLQERLREKIGPDVRHSPFIQNILPSTPQEFKEKNIYPYTPEQLINKIFTEPNEEYYYILLEIAGNDDQFLLNISKEIAKAHPWYMVQYSMRNFRHALFDPGFATTRYNTLGYGHAGYDFIPGSPSWGVRSADTVGQFGPRATKEMEYFPVKTAPIVIQVLFYGIKKAHMKSYNTYIRITSLLVIIAWLAACLGVLSHVFSHRKFFQRIKNIGTDRLIAPIIAASALVVYEGLVTSVFCQPVYRYFHLTEPLRLVVAGFGAVFLTYLISSWFVWKNSNINKSINHFVLNIQKYDLFQEYFSQRRTLWFVLLVSLNIILFGWWVLSMLAHTS